MVLSAICTHCTWSGAVQLLHKTICTLFQGILFGQHSSGLMESTAVVLQTCFGQRKRVAQKVPRVLPLPPAVCILLQATHVVRTSPHCCRSQLLRSRVCTGLSYAGL